jgi:hypothetical protein
MRSNLGKQLFLATSLVVFALTVARPTRAQPAEGVSFDTVSTLRVGPGMTHAQVEAPSVPWRLDVLKVDLTNPFLETETATTGGDIDDGSEVVSSMAARHDSAGHRVVGATNGDFYDGGRPKSIQIQDGQVTQDEGTWYGNPEPALGFSPDNRVMLNPVDFSGRVMIRSAIRDIDKVNEARGTDQLILYNKFIGGSTETGAGGAEVAVRPLGDWIVNDEMRVKAARVRSGQGDMAIPEGGAVLSGRGAAADFLNENVSEDDTLRMSINASPGLDRLEAMVSGQPYIVQDGDVPRNVPRGDADDRHPRTAAGFSEDSTTLYLVTVDGRQAASAGMKLPELADFMTRIGVHTAVNLDGGGSSTMIVRGDMVNAPSGNQQRAIASNALLIVSTAPKGPLAHLQVDPVYQKLFMGESVRFEASGADQYYNPINLQPSDLQFSVDPELGSINSEGVFTAGAELDTGDVYVSYDGMTDTARVIVKTVARFEMTPRDVVTDTTQDLQFKIAAYDQDGQRQRVPRKAFAWSSTNPSVGTVDSTGDFRGRSEGTTRVVASYRGLSDTTRVTVNVRTSTHLVSALEEAERWQLSGDNMNMDETQLSVASQMKTQGQGALELNYTYPTDGLHYVRMAANHPLEGVPDTLLIDARSSNTALNQVQVDVLDAEGHPFRLFSTSFADAASFKTLPMMIDDAAPRGEHGTMYFPIEIQRIRVQLRGRPGGDQASYSGTLHLDNLRANYADQQTDVTGVPDEPSQLRLLPSHPNPFRERTNLTYVLDQPREVHLVVYDALGRRVRTLVAGERQRAGRHEVTLQGRSLPAGVYFYRLQAGGQVRTGNATRVR